MATTNYADSGTMPASTRMRSRIAEALLQSGMNTSPISSHWQGLSRVAQALIGGMMAGKIEREENAQREGLSNVVQALLGGGNTSGGVTAPVGAPPAGMSRIASASGAPVTVATPNAPAFQRLMSSLEQAGITIDPSQTGGYANRNIAGTNIPSQHARGRAVDINWRDNPQGRMDPLADQVDYQAGVPVSPGAAPAPITRIPSYVARQAAADSGTRWGGDFRNAPGGPDPMHFEVAPGAPAPAAMAQAPAGAAPQAVADGVNLSPQARAAIAAIARVNPQAALQMVLPMLAKEGQPTELQRNYAAYVRDQIARGQPVQSFDEWDLSRRRAGATAITTVERGERAFESEAGKRLAQQYTEMVQQGREARNTVAQLGMLQELAPQIGTGLGAVIMQRIGPLAEALGVNVSGLGETQAFQAIVSQMAPRMRVPGSGATSDFEMRQYLASLPQLINTPGGNELIARTNSAIAQSQMQAAEIASRALSGEISHREAEKLLQAIPSPLEEWKRATREQPRQPGAQPSAPRERTYNPATGQLE